VITWSRTGGIAGLRETMRIGLDRRVVADGNGRGTEGRLSRRRYRRLRGPLDDARLETRKARYPAPGAADTLAAARARWRHAGLRSYRFRLRVSCFCPEAGVERVIRVRAGRPHGGKGADTVVDTVPEMFRQIRDALDSDRSGDVTVRYDPELGYPRSASIDRIEMAIDDEISWTARGLRPLPAG
jgi:hypothetical protein